MRWTPLLIAGALLTSMGAASRADLAPPRPATHPPPKVRWVEQPKPTTAVPDAKMAPAETAAAADGGADPVVVTVGQTEVRASELSFLLNRLHEFERQSYGSTPDEVKREFIARRLVPELLGAEEARRRGSSKKPAIARHVRKQLNDALGDQLKRDADAKLTEAQIREYCETQGGRRPRPDAGAGKSPECSGDLSGHRVALRRTLASKQLSAISEKLRRQHVRGVNYAALSLIDVSDQGTTVAVPVSSGHRR